MNNPILANELAQEYHSILPKAEQLKSDLLREIGRQLVDQDITLGTTIEGRVKTLSSISEKNERKSLSLHNISDLDDLIGIRIVVLYLQDVPKVRHIIRNMLDVITDEDTSTRLSATQFGYQSHHYIVKLHKDWLKLPSFTFAEELKIEIQIRTLAQHIWAVASHQLQYKHEESIPASVRRAIHRVSALLETVDLEFERVLADRSEYIENRENHPVFNEELNVDIVRDVLNRLLPAEKKAKNENYGDLLDDLLHFNINKPENLELLIKKHYNEIFKEEYRLVDTSAHYRNEDDDETDDRPQTVYFVHTGLVREGLREEFGDEVVTEWLRSKHKR